MKLALPTTNTERHQPFVLTIQVENRVASNSILKMAYAAVLAAVATATVTAVAFVPDVWDKVQERLISQFLLQVRMSSVPKPSWLLSQASRQRLVHTIASQFSDGSHMLNALSALCQDHPAAASAAILWSALSNRPFTTAGLVARFGNCLTARDNKEAIARAASNGSVSMLEDLLSVYHGPPADVISVIQNVDHDRFDAAKSTLLQTRWFEANHCAITNGSYGCS
jgi:hypothetical protein